MENLSVTHTDTEDVSVHDVQNEAQKPAELHGIVKASTTHARTAARAYPGSEVAARQEHEAIVEELARLDRDWVALGKRMCAFTKAKYFKLIQNSETGKRFTRAVDWIRFVTGQCPSGFFRDQRILRELEGLVTDQDLKKMTRENAETLVKHAKAGHKLSKKLVKKATKLQAKKFKKEVNGTSGAAAKEDTVAVGFETFGPVPLTRGALQVVHEAMDKAKEGINVPPELLDGAALEKIARTFLAVHDEHETLAEPLRQHEQEDAPTTAIH